MAMSVLNNKLKSIIDSKNKKFENDDHTFHIYVEGIGLLIVLLDDVEIVDDDWYSSTKYSKSNIEFDSNSGVSIKLTNVYQKNAVSSESKNNQIYNLIFDKIEIFVDKIIAFY